MSEYGDLIAEARKAQRLCNSSGEEYYAVQFGRLAGALEVCKDEYGKLERENAALRTELAALTAQSKWEYGVQWGDDGTITYCGGCDRANGRASTDHGDVVVKRTQKRITDPGPWIPADEEPR